MHAPLTPVQDRGLCPLCASVVRASLVAKRAFFFFVPAVGVTRLNAMLACL